MPFVIESSFFRRRIGRSKQSTGARVCLIAAFCAIIVLLGGVKAPSLDAATQDSPQTLSKKISSTAPQSCLSWFQWSNPIKADANSTNAVDRMMAEQDVNAFCKDLTDKLGQLPAVLIPAEAPEIFKKAASTLGPQLVDAILRKQGCLFVESFELNDDLEPTNLKLGAVLEIGTGVNDTLSTIQDLLKLGALPVQQGDIAGNSYFKIDTPPNGPFSEIGVMKQGDYLLVASSVPMLQEISTRMADGKVADWLKQLQAGQGYQRMSAIGKIDLAKLKKLFLPLADPKILSNLGILGLDNLESFEFSGGYDTTDFAQRYALKFDGSPTGIFDVGGDKGLTAGDLAHFPEDSFFALAGSVDGKKVFSRLQQILVQMDPRTARDFAVGLVELQSQTGIDLRQTIENLGPTFSIHNGFGDGIFSGTLFTATVQDSALLEKTIKDGFRVLQNSQSDVRFAVDSTQQNGKPIGIMRFAGLPVPAEPSWHLNEDKIAIAMFPPVLSSVTKSNSAPPLIQSKSFEPYLPLLQSQADNGKVIGFSYAENKRSFELLYGYACVLSAMGKNAISGSLNPRMGLGVNPEQAQKLFELFKDLQLPACRSVVEHLTPQITIIRQETDAIVFESHSSLTSSNIVMLMPGVAVGMLLPAVQAVRAAARRTQSANNIRQLGLACHNYESTYLHFPSGNGPVKKGGPPVSWRVKILPFIEQNALYAQYNVDEPWDSENNRKLLDKMPPVFQNPASVAEPGYTVYRGIGGTGGIMGVNGRGQSRGKGFGEISDGTSNTILLIETPDEMAVEWTRPDSGIDPQKVKVWQMIGNHPGGFNVCFGDGSVQFLPETLDDEIFQHLMDLADGFVVPRNF